MNTVFNREWHQLFCTTTYKFTQDPWECGNHVVVYYEVFNMHEFTLICDAFGEVVDD